MKRMPSRTRAMAAGALAALCALQAAAGALEIEITGVESDEGAVMLEILAGEAGFRGETPPIAQLLLPARVPSVAVRIDALPPGDYAVRVFHDIDGDGALATNLIGMPSEPWGVSNDATGRFGPPGWEDARFTLKAEDGAQQRIRLNH